MPSFWGHYSKSVCPLAGQEYVPSMNGEKSGRDNGSVGRSSFMWLANHLKQHLGGPDNSGVYDNSYWPPLQVHLSSFFLFAEINSSQ